MLSWFWFFHATLSPLRWVAWARDTRPGRGRDESSLGEAVLPRCGCRDGVAMILTGVKWSLILVASLAAGPAASEPNAPRRLDIAAAREDVRIGEEALRRLRARFEALQSSQSATPGELEQYESYLLRLAAQVAAHRHELQSLQAAQDARPGMRRGAGVSGSPGKPSELDISADVAETDELAGLDRQLGTSLGAFDDMLLREARRASQRPAGQRAQTPGGRDGFGGGDGSEGTGQDGTGHGEADTDHGEATTTSGTRGTSSGGTDTQSGEETTASVQDPRDPGKAKGTGRTRSPVPPDIPDGSDDDIVARQIREAAENETDPALREKLWDEYRRYKKGAG